MYFDKTNKKKTLILSTMLMLRNRSYAVVIVCCVAHGCKPSHGWLHKIFLSIRFNTTALHNPKFYRRKYELSNGAIRQGKGVLFMRPRRASSVQQQEVPTLQEEEECFNGAIEIDWVEYKIGDGAVRQGNSVLFMRSRRASSIQQQQVPTLQEEECFNGAIEIDWVE